MKIGFTLLLAADLLTGCGTKHEEAVPQIAIPPVATEKMKNGSYLALGDSYTVGESVATAESFPYQLAAALKKQGISVTDPQVVARTGWTTNELQDGILEAKITGTFQVVTLLIGVNNQYRGYSPITYREEFKALLTEALRYAGGDKTHLFVLSIPDWGAMPFAEGRDRDKIAAEIDVFNAINREETEKAGCHYTDIMPLSRKALADNSLAAADGLHPSGKQYGQWVQLLLPQVLAAFKVP